MRTARTIGAALTAGALALIAPLGLAASASAAEPLVVSITVELDLPGMDFSDGPSVFQVTDVTAGPGPELTGANLVANPTPWCGAVNVDIDPTNKTILVYGDPDGVPVREGALCDFQTVSVTITSPQIGNIVLVEDALLEETEGCPPPTDGDGDGDGDDIIGDGDGEGDEGDQGDAGDVVSGAFNAQSAASVDNGVWVFDYADAAGVTQLSWASLPEPESENVYGEPLFTCGSTLLTFTQLALLASTGATVSPLALGVGGAVVAAGILALVGAAAVRRARV